MPKQTNNQMVHRNAMFHEAKLRAGAAAGLTLTELAGECCVSAPAVKRYLTYLGITINRPLRGVRVRPDPVMRERDENVVRLYIEQHLTYEQIAVHFGITRERVRQILNRQGVEHKEYRQHVKTWPCPACGSDVHTKIAVKKTFCSLECAGDMRRRHKLTRDDAVRLMAMRDSGMSWAECSQEVLGHAHSRGLVLRGVMSRTNRHLFSTEERAKYFPTNLQQIPAEQ